MISNWSLTTSHYIKENKDLTLTKRFIIVSLFLFIWTFPAESQDGLIINADNVSYEKEKNQINAQGNVVATYQDLKITADRLVYNTKDRTVFADEGFILEIPQKKIIGKKLDYDIDTKVGTAEDVLLEFRNTYISGKKVSLSTEEVNMTDAIFTSCDLPSPHYHVSASNITLYPTTGWIVAYMGFFWVGNVPIIPVPTYVYVIGRKGGRRNVTPIPEIGKNDVDGVYGIERIAWHMSNKMYGSFDLILTEKLGGGAKITGNYIADEQNEFNFRIGALEKDNSFGGVTYIHSFGPKIEFTEEEESLYTMFDFPSERLYEFEVNLSYRERINYERVSALPDLTLRLIKGHLFHEKLLIQGEIGYGLLTEESTGVERYRSRIDFDIIHPRDLGRFGRLTFTVSPDYKWYESKEIWQKLTGDIDLKKKWNEIFETGIGYMHYFLNQGATPFAFETYFFRPDDEFRENLLLRFGDSDFGFYVTHYMPDWYPKDVDYVFNWAHHCYDIMLKYRAMREEFSIGVSLTSR